MSSLLIPYWLWDCKRWDQVFPNKNSRETNSGEEGYIFMQRDIDAKEGLYGIAVDASYPTA